MSWNDLREAMRMQPSNNEVLHQLTRKWKCWLERYVLCADLDGATRIVNLEGLENMNFLMALMTANLCTTLDELKLSKEKEAIQQAEVAQLQARVYMLERLQNEVLTSAEEDTDDSDFTPAVQVDSEPEYLMDN